MKISKLAFALALLPVSAFAQDSAVPVQAVQVAPEPETYLPAGTTIPLKMTQTVTTKGDSWKEGDQFNLVVAANVMLGDYIVIPEGTKAVGRITWLTSRGAFGKSGKMDVELEYIQLGNRRVNLDGTYRQEGDGATLATVGGVIAAGVFAGFITGKSGVIPQGRELNATLESNLPVALPKGASVVAPAIKATAVAPVQAAGAVEPIPAEAEAAAAPVQAVGAAEPVATESEPK